MASAMRVLRKFRASDGRIKIATLSGVSVLVAVIALLVGVLPVFASHPEAVPLDEGGGSGKCFVDNDGLPSAATNEFHIANPKPADSPYFSADGAIRIDVYDIEEGTVFDFNAEDTDYVVYDVIVNGGPKTLHYDYSASEDGPVPNDEGLHAPNQGPSKYHNLSHINLCYDVPGLTTVPCDVEPPIRIEGEGLLSIGEVTIFQNSLHDCTDKRASFFIENELATLNFLGDGTDTVAGRLNITKEFGAPPTTGFPDLQYDGSGTFADVLWCVVRGKDTTPDSEGKFDGDQFDDVLAANEYPSLPGDETACKVSEEENAAGVQYNVVYFEFVDPNFR